ERAVEQHVVECGAGAAAQSAEPRIGELERRKGVVGAGKLDVSLHAEHELAALPIIANLPAACDAARLNGGIGDLAPFVAEVETGISAAPVIKAGLRRGVIRSRATR